MGGQNGMWGMGDHFRPIGAHELMMQVPLIFRQPGRIPPGRTNDFLVSNYDFMPSVLNYLGLREKMPQKPKSPGRDFSPVLLGQTIPWDNVIYYEMETVRAIRTDDWKYVGRIRPTAPRTLQYEARPARTFQPLRPTRHEAKRTELSARLNEFFTKIRRSPVRHLERRTIQGGQTGNSKMSPEINIDSF